MNFNTHSNLIGKHAFLSASQYHWVNYTEERLEERLFTALAAARGTELHEFASDAIRLGIKLQGSKTTLSMYVNDAIGFRMTPEQVLYYSDNAFGTTDAISFSRGKLRIHDLKTGVTKASMTQLKVYVALFCLEYSMKPSEFKTQLRIYQNDDILEEIPEIDEIVQIMDRIITFDKRIEMIKAEVLP